MRASVLDCAAAPLSELLELLNALKKRLSTGAVQNAPRHSGPRPIHLREAA